MRPSNRLTPYPVLASYRDDYLNSSFRAKIDAVQQFGDIHLSIEFELDEPTLEALVREGRAEYAIHIECRTTTLRMYEGTRAGLYSTTLKRFDVRDFVEVCTFVVAREPIAGLVSERFHPDYDGFSFDVDRGSVLAIGDCGSIEIKDNDDIERRSSVLRVTRAGKSQRDALAVNTDQSNCVLVSLRPELYKIYNELGAGADSELILSLVILPALQIVLTRMAAAGEDSVDTEKDWFKSIVAILEKNDLSLDDIDNYSENMSALAIAQRMLSQPLERSLMGLVKEV